MTESSSSLCGFISDQYSPLERYRQYVQQGWFSNDIHYPSYSGFLVPITIIGSLIFHAFCYLILADIISKKLSSTFRKKIFYDHKERKEWNSRVVSNIHAIITSIVSLYCLMTVYWSDHNEDKSTSLLSRKSNACFFLLSYSVGYFIYDLIIVITNYPHLGGIETVLHHSVSIIALLSSSVWEECIVILVYMELTEISTPFVNQRYFFSLTDMRSSKLYVYNGLAMWLSFGIVRISLCFYLPYLFWTESKTMCTYPLGWIIGIQVLFCTISGLNIYWFYKITTGLINIAFGGGSGKNIKQEIKPEEDNEEEIIDIQSFHVERNYKEEEHE
ncbi:hypothetical protein ABK040_001884 [Willaertia magna]